MSTQAADAEAAYRGACVAIGNLHAKIAALTKALEEVQRHVEYPDDDLRPKVLKIIEDALEGEPDDERDMEPAKRKDFGVEGLEKGDR